MPKKFAHDVKDCVVRLVEDCVLAENLSLQKTLTVRAKMSSSTPADETTQERSKSRHSCGCHGGTPGQLNLGLNHQTHILFFMAKKHVLPPLIILTIHR